MKSLVRLYSRFSAAASYLQSPLLVAIRLYWGWQIMLNGWGKLHHLAKITEFFASLNIPFPSINAPFVAGLEFIGGILLMAGLGTRLIALLLAVDMLVAFWTADHDAFVTFFTNPDKFIAADPFSLLFAALIVLIFGAGLFSLDAVLAKRLKDTIA